MNKGLRTTFLMFFLVLALGCYNVFFAEKIPWSNGLGADGTVYGRIAKDPVGEIQSGKLDAYYVGRIFPSAVVHYELKIFSLPLDDVHIIKGFELNNSLLLLIAVFLWQLIANELGLSLKGRWLGFIGLFVNFFNLKFNTYYPVLTDVTAFTVGMAMVYGFLARRSFLLLALAAVGSFTWPPALPTGLLLYLFPRKRTSGVHSRTFFSNDRISLALSSGFFAMAFYVYYARGYTFNNGTIGAWVPVSAIVVFLYLYFSTRGLNAQEALNLDSYDRQFLLRAAVVVAIVVLLKIIVFSLSSGSAKFTFRDYVYVNAARSVAKPFVFGLAHVVYFGPIVLLAYFLWGSVCKSVNHYGLGAVLVVLMTVVQSLGSESRQLAMAFPFVVAWTVQAMERLDLKSHHYAIIAITSLIYSKIWFLLNASGPIILDEATFFDFPGQRLFMSVGDWMSVSMYLIQGGVLVATAILFYFSIFKGRQRIAET